MIKLFTIHLPHGNSCPQHPRPKVCNDLFGPLGKHSASLTESAPSRQGISRNRAKLAPLASMPGNDKVSRSTEPIYWSEIMKIARHYKQIALASLVQIAAMSPGYGASSQEPDFQFALLEYPGGNWNPRPQGLDRLAWEVHTRTSIAVDLAVTSVDPSTDAIFNYPLLVWQGDQGFPPLPPTAVSHLRQHIRRGGTLLVDLSDGSPGGPFDRAVRRELARILPSQNLQRVPTDHVLYKSFYLLQRHGGRVPARSYLEGIFVEGRLAVVHFANDLAGALARDDYGQWQYDIQAGGNAAREVTVRLGINVAMYSLCLNYKSDAVHTSTILKRRQ